MALVEWIRDVAPDQAFLFAFPFFVAMVGIASEWWHRRR